MSRIVFFDLETAGKEPGRHPIIQFAGIAVDARSLAPVDEMELRIQLYQKDEWQPEALAGNVFAAVTGFGRLDRADTGQLVSEAFERCAKKWNEQAMPRSTALAKINSFLEQHKFVPMRGKNPPHNEYKVAKLAGHNVAAFDVPHLRALYGARFFPCEFRCLDTMHLASWVSFMESGTENVPINLQALRERYGVRVPGDAHDALTDVRATLEVARRLMFDLSKFRLPAGAETP